MAELTCPHCQSPTTELIPVSIALRNKYKVVKPSITLPNAICSNCMNELNASLEQKSTILINEKNKEDSKIRLWKSRVVLLKKARSQMTRKSYGEAVVSYEKYLRLLETVFEVKEGGVQPEMLKERQSTKELTVITSVYWDLLRVYDTNEKYRKRMEATAQKLLQFAPFTPITIDIVKKADAYRSKSRNPDVFKNLSRDLMYKKNFCFIATCLFEHHKDKHYIRKLQSFRDKVLLKSVGGKVFVFIYYRVSPPLARGFDCVPFIKPPLRWGLKIIAKALS